MKSTRHLAQRVLATLVMLSVTALVLVGFSSPAQAITEGTPTSISSYPYMAELTIPSGIFGHLVTRCGGTLIGPRWILTAAHCLTDSKGNKLTPGALTVSVGKDMPSWSKLKVNRVERNPDYRNDLVLSPGDIGLVQIEQPVSYAPLALAAAEPTPGSSVRLLGWGCTWASFRSDCDPSRALNTAVVTALDDQSCGLKSPTLAAVYDICSVRNSKSSMRHGDSGGPMIKQTPLGARLAGVMVNFDTAHDFSTSVPYVLPWIHQITGIGAPAESNPVPAPPANNPAPPAGSPTYTAHVMGTCNEGHCGLTIRVTPGYTNVGSVGALTDGTAYTIVCQVRGETVTGRNGSSNVWNGFIYGGVRRYVSDYYSDTPGINQTIAGIRTC